MRPSAASISRRRLLRGRPAGTALGLVGGAGVLPGVAQPPAWGCRVGFLSGGASALNSENVEAFREGMLELGCVEGRDFTLETRFAEGRVERSVDLAAELVRLPVDLIVAVGTVPARAARDATSTVPIVMVR